MDEKNKEGITIIILNCQRMKLRNLRASRLPINGVVKTALEVPVEVAREYGAPNKHQNGWVVTTNKNFLNDRRAKNITASMSALNV